MAALWGLTVLLLFAPFIGLTEFRYVSTTLPPPITAPSASFSVTSSPPLTMTAAPTLSDISVSTKLPLISATLSSNPSHPPISPSMSAQTQCFYTVTAIPFGLQIDMRLNFTAGNYRIYLTKEGKPETRKTFNIQSSNPNPTYEIRHLKPCTKYQYEVVFIDNDGSETSCNHAEDKNGTVTTERMREGDIKGGSSIPGFISFQSDWDISSSLLTPNKHLQYINETYRLKLDSEDICSDFTATFTSGNCVNSSINVTVVILHPSEIKQSVSTGLPATINTTFPSKCKNLSVDYTCSENGKVSDSKKLFELEPFTDYTCTGLIKDNNVPLDKRTTPIHVRIDCSFTPKEITSMRKTTNTSIELTWTTTSDNCQDDLPRLQNLSLSYDCSCETNKSKSQRKSNLISRPDGGKCDFTGLLPYTDYTCDIVPTSNKDNKDDQRLRVYQRTDAGKPADITNVIWSLSDNNLIIVNCTHPRSRLFGPKATYRARLINVDDKPRENWHCGFEFRDLSYSTSYTVVVTVYNGVLESNPKIIDVSTKYNNKAVIIGFMCFLIIITFVVVFVVIYKIYMKKRRESRGGVNDDMMLESAIYMNTRPPGRRHKAAH